MGKDPKLCQLCSDSIDLLMPKGGSRIFSRGGGGGGCGG